MAGQHCGQHAQVHKRGRANLEAMRRAAPFAVDVKAQFALGILRAGINFSGRRVPSLRDGDELVDQLLPYWSTPCASAAGRSCRRASIRFADFVVGPPGQLVETLAKNANALAHFLHAHG
jgi:hypothetical protein